MCYDIENDLNWILECKTLTATATIVQRITLGEIESKLLLI